MIQEKEWYLSMKSLMELMFPIGYIFSWIHIKDSDVDLSTPEKVHDYFGFGTWELYDPGVYDQCIATQPEDVDNSSVIVDGIKAPQLVSKDEYTVIDQDGRVYFISDALVYSNYLDKKELSEFPRIIPSKSTEYSFAVDSEGALYRYDIDQSIDIFGTSQKHLIYPSRPIQGYYTIITADGKMYNCPRHFLFDPREKSNPDQEKYFIGYIQDLPFTKTKYYVKYKQSGDVIDIRNYNYRNNARRKVLKIDMDGDSICETEATYDSDSGWYLIDDIQHGLLSRVYLIKLIEGTRVFWYEETFTGFQHQNERKILNGGPWSPKGGVKQYYLKPFKGGLLEAYRQGGFSSSMSPDAIYETLSIDTSKTRVYAIGYDQRVKNKEKEPDIVWTVLVFEGAYEGDEKTLNFNVVWNGKKIREYEEIPYGAPTDFPKNSVITYLEAYDPPRQFGIYYDPILYSKEANGNQEYIYGNIDLMKRQRLYWTNTNLTAFSKELDSWGGDHPEEGSYSTVYGASMEFEGVEIAFSPIRQTSQGPKLLNKTTVTNYISGLVSVVKKKSGWSNEDLFAIDKWKLIAAIGSDARDVGSRMHTISEQIENNKNRLVSKGGNWTIIEYDIDSEFDPPKNGSSWNDHFLKTYEGNTEELPEVIKNCSEFYEAYDVGDGALTIGDRTYAYYDHGTGVWSKETIPAGSDVDDLPHQNDVKDGRTLRIYDGAVPDEVGVTGIAGYFAFNGEKESDTNDPVVTDSDRIYAIRTPDTVWHLETVASGTPRSKLPKDGGSWNGYKLAKFVDYIPLINNADIFEAYDAYAPETTPPSIPPSVELPKGQSSIYLVIFNEESPAVYDEQVQGKQVYLKQANNFMAPLIEHGVDQSGDNGYIFEYLLDINHPLYKPAYHFYLISDASLRPSWSGSYSGQLNLDMEDAYYEIGLRRLPFPSDSTADDYGVPLPDIPIRNGLRTIDQEYRKYGVSSGYTVVIEEVFLGCTRFRRLKGNGETGTGTGDDGTVTREVDDYEYNIADTTELKNIGQVLMEVDYNLLNIEGRLDTILKLCDSFDLDGLRSDYENLIATINGIKADINSAEESVASLEKSKQDNMEFDEVPTVRSKKAVYSRGIKSAIDEATVHNVVYRWRRVA